MKHIILSLFALLSSCAAAFADELEVGEAVEITGFCVGLAPTIELARVSAMGSDELTVFLSDPNAGCFLQFLGQMPESLFAIISSPAILSSVRPDGEVVEFYEIEAPWTEGVKVYSWALVQGEPV
jgi:hypothetical protein